MRVRPSLVRGRSFAALLFCAWLLSSAPLFAQGSVPIIVLDFELYDTSLEGEVKGLNADEQERLKLISGQLRELLGASDRYSIIDTAPAAQQIADGGNWQDCTGCDIKIAQLLGAQLAVTGRVQKVSNLILNINIYVRSVDTGKVVQFAGADIRGNTDKSWMRGVSWLVRNRLLKN